MTDFNDTNWAKREFSNDYLDKADIYIVDRRKMFAIFASLVSHFMQPAGLKRTLDLGCGDGVMTHELLRLDPSISATLVDGSHEMLAKAKERLCHYEKTEYIKAAFQELLINNVLPSSFDLVFSSMAIHHLTMEEKKALFKKVYGWLGSGGIFVNIDVVLPPTEALDEWYMKLWEDWMVREKTSLGFEDEDSQDIIRRYKKLEENKPDTLEEQINALRIEGFRDVDCYYKHCIFTIFGGRK